MKGPALPLHSAPQWRAPRNNPHQNHTTDEVVALSLLVAGTLLFLALISYTPSDVPAWYPLSSVARAGRGTANFIGAFGAIVACTLYSLLGVASFLVTAVLLGCGGVKLIHSGLPRDPAVVMGHWIYPFGRLSCASFTF